MLIDSYDKIRKIRGSVIEEIDVEYPSLSLSDKLVIVEARVHSVLMSGLDETSVAEVVANEDSLKRS